MWPSSLSTQILRVEQPKMPKWSLCHNILSIPLIIKTQKYYASHSEKKSYLTLTIERGNNTFPTPSRFSLVLVSRLFRLFARCLWTRTIRQWTFIWATSRLSVTLRHGWRCSRNSSRRAIRACERNERVLILFFCARLLSNLLCARCMRWRKSRNQSH